MKRMTRTGLYTLLTVGLFAVSGWAKTRPRPVARPAVLMYLTDRPDSIADFRAHARQIDIAAPQVLTMAADGRVSGGVPAIVSATARKFHIRLMPLVTNAGFSLAVMDRALHSPAAERRLLRELVRRGRAGHWWGIQFDFEHIPSRDRARYSHLAGLARRAFHRAGMKFSVTIVPRMSNNPRDFSAGGWKTWSGVYGYRALGRAADFVTVMTYSEFSGLTQPGPVSGMPWIRRCLRYALANMPARKISIGAAFYSQSWRGAAHTAIPSVPRVPKVYRPLHPSPWHGRTGETTWLTALWKRYPGVWNPAQQAYVTRHRGERQTRVIWWSMARSLRRLWILTRRDHLAGISAWRLGQEDPRVWKVLP